MQYTVLEKGELYLDSSWAEDLNVRHKVRQLDDEDTPQVSQMECVQHIFLSGVEGPGLGHKGDADDTCYSVDGQLVT